jgi:DnaK suppressor protein
MNPMQLAYFQRKLLSWRAELLQESEETRRELVEETENTYGTAGDDVDRANDETMKQLELRARDRERKLLAQIDAALGRIEDGTFGYCDITGEPIGLARLEARPIAMRSVEAQEEHENMEKVYSS